MTGQENERLAVVETKVSALVADVAEIKQDVKVLLASRSRLAGMAAIGIQLIPFVALGVSIWAVAAK